MQTEKIMPNIKTFFFLILASKVHLGRHNILTMANCLTVPVPQWKAVLTVPVNGLTATLIRYFDSESFNRVLW